MWDADKGTTEGSRQDPLPLVQLSDNATMPSSELCAVKENVDKFQVDARRAGRIDDRVPVRVTSVDVSAINQRASETPHTLVHRSPGQNVEGGVLVFCLLGLLFVVGAVIFHKTKLGDLTTSRRLSKAVRMTL